MPPLFAAENPLGELIAILLIGGIFWFIYFLVTLPSTIRQARREKAEREAEKRAFAEAVDEEFEVVFSSFADKQGRLVKLVLVKAETGESETLTVDSKLVDPGLEPKVRVQVKRSGDRIWSVTKM